MFLNAWNWLAVGRSAGAGGRSEERKCSGRGIVRPCIVRTHSGHLTRNFFFGLTRQHIHVNQKENPSLCRDKEGTAHWHCSFGSQQTIPSGGNKLQRATRVRTTTTEYIITNAPSPPVCFEPAVIVYHRRFQMNPAVMLTHHRRVILQPGGDANISPPVRNTTRR